MTETPQPLLHRRCPVCGGALDYRHGAHSCRSCQMTFRQKAARKPKAATRVSPSTSPARDDEPQSSPPERLLSGPPRPDTLEWAASVLSDLDVRLAAARTERRLQEHAPPREEDLEVLREAVGCKRS